MNDIDEGRLKRIVEDGVSAAMERLGLDVKNPMEMQRDMQHLREMRLAVASFKSKAFLTVLAVALTGILGALWVGLKQSILGHQ